MASITIQLPVVDADSKIEIEVRVNGNKRKYHYRVELFEWDECIEVENKAVCLKDKIEEYDPHWKLVQIGEATEKNISVMFKEKN